MNQPPIVRSGDEPTEAQKKVEELVKWVAEQIPHKTGVDYELLTETFKEHNREIAKQILSHPDLALINREVLNNPEEGFDDAFTWYPVIPLADVLKEAKK